MPRPHFWWQDQVLLGANVAYDLDREWANDLGLMTYASSCINDLPGGFPEEWVASTRSSPALFVPHCMP